jgi:hypothetical protein
MFAVAGQLVLTRLYHAWWLMGRLPGALRTASKRGLSCLGAGAALAVVVGGTVGGETLPRG